ncbi:MAG: aminotransferase class V-fold PLP-dependent enzyme [Nannocystaceae bacterium]
MPNARPFDVDFVRGQFPALRDDWALFDNAGGSLACQQVIHRVTTYLEHYGIQLGATYPRSLEAAELVRRGRQAAADLVNADLEEVVITGSTTMSAYILAHAMAPNLKPGDNIVVTDIDHEANIGAWRRLEERGVELREWRHNADSLALEMDELKPLLDERTRLVTFSHCPNVTGSIHDAHAIIATAHDAGAQVCVDGVAFAPHRRVDVRDLDADYYLVSLYKVFGPHQGLLFGKREHLRDAVGQNHYFITEDEVPYKLQPGNVNHELTASLPGIVEYLETLASHHGVTCDSTHEALNAAFDLIASQEATLVAPLIAYLRDRDDVRIIGRPTEDADARVATVAFEVEGRSSTEVTTLLQEHHVAVRFGDFYARRGVARMPLLHSDGMVRVSMAHYNHPEEVARLIAALDQIK